MKPDKWDGKHLRDVDAYLKQIEKSYADAIGKLTQIASQVPVSASPFSYRDNPAFKNQFESIFKQLSRELEATVLKGIDDQWAFGDRKALQSVAEKLKGKLSTKAISMLESGKFGSTAPAYNAFLNRTKTGLNLSERVWAYSSRFKTDMELGMALGLNEGKSAHELALDMQKHLKRPDDLYRRVRDAKDELQLSLPAKLFAPGEGIYRSSYKNALRMTRTEINMAYRRSENARYQTLPFVVGFEVKLSNAHPVYDICDELQGKYPKEFVFSGWHPQCLCHVTSILNTDEEYDKLEEAILNGEELPTSSTNTVGTPPKGFTDWVENNKQRAADWKNQPYFIQDNFKGGNLEKGLKF